jgi:hypothetical protein
MSASAIGGAVFVCVFGGALLGMFLGNVLPKHHVGNDTKDVVKAAMAMIATLAALVIGLLIASAKTSFDNKEGTIKRLASQALQLDSMLVEYGPEAREARDQLRQAVATAIGQIWPRGSAGNLKPEIIGRSHGIEAVQHKLQGLSPQSDEQRWLKSTALQISYDMAAARWLVFHQLSSSIQWPLLIVLIFWVVAIFVTFGLFAPRNGTVIAALLLSALSVGGAIYLILEMDQPYGGYIEISDAPLNSTLNLLGR